jgi:anti-sigma B factor antagonist
MTIPSSTFTIRRTPKKVAIIDIQGDVTAGTDDALTSAFADASNGSTTIVLNFVGLDYMNSSGIGQLVTLLIRAQRNKQKLFAYGLSDHYKQIFQLTRLDEAIGIYDSEDRALAAA